ncbi:MAG TPA: GNAT family N-acetyltransferase [Candidatus Limnocylindria bacterium]|nr:GNAT family N-acetyltransferase [Candidatus Limnocylindria bacterium]
MPGSGARLRRMAVEQRQGELFAEKDFYLEEFRGRSVLVAVAPGAADLGPLAGAIGDLVRNDTRVLLCWFDLAPAAQRRVRAALGRAKGLGRRAMPGLGSVVPADGAAHARGADTLRAELWGILRHERLCVRAAESPFPGPAPALATALRIPKLVLADPQGGLLAGRQRLSFVDAHVLDTLLHQGQAEWSGLGERRALLVAVREALQGGVESVNLCTAEGIAEELFTYEGSGTLFTRDDYCRVAPLGLDDFAQAERLLERGQREGILKLRSEREIAEVLAVGFGATICGRHLAGVAGLLSAPYAAERAGEIVGLYTITRFKGEGIGQRLVTRLLAEAAERRLAYVFACAVDERAVQFFLRLGFERVGAEEVPAAKWAGYDARRRPRVVVCKRRLDAGLG